MFWVGNQGEGTSPCCTLFFSDFRTSFSFSLWLGWWDHFTRRTETFQKISNMYGYLFVHITLHGFFSEFSVVRGGGNDETVSTGCGSPSVLHPWMLLLHMQETALWIPPVCCVLDDICKRQLLWIPRGAFCPLEGGPRHIGTDTLAPVLQCKTTNWRFIIIVFVYTLSWLIVAGGWMGLWVVFSRKSQGLVKKHSYFMQAVCILLKCGLTVLKLIW